MFILYNLEWDLIFIEFKEYKYNWIHFTWKVRLIYVYLHGIYVKR